MPHSYTYKMQFNVEVIQVFRVQYSDGVMKRNTLHITFLGMYSVFCNWIQFNSKLPNTASLLFTQMSLWRLGAMYVYREIQKFNILEDITNIV